MPNRFNKKISLFVPGRLCLFGEHTDWAGHYRTMNADITPGAAIVTGIEQGIYADIEESATFQMQSTSEDIAHIWKDFSCRMNEQELKKVARSGDFFCYCAGVASYMLEWYKVGGVKITITKMTLPIKSGLSSSAAICVLVARAFNLIYNLNLNTLGEMNIAYLGELRTSSRCGRLDQACAFGVKPSLMTFDGDEIEVQSLNIGKQLHWVFADLAGKKDTIRILSDLNKAYPFPSNEMEEQAQLALGEKNQAVVQQAIAYLAAGDAEGIGRLMRETEEMFDHDLAPLSPKELASPKLKAILADPKAQSLSYGGKGVGSHGDGSVQFIARDKQCQEDLVDYLNSLGMHAYPLTLKPSHIVKKAIIPVAGFGTRLYPSTRYVRKEFFPIPCSDGLVRPVILILIEELLASGIEEICLVVGSEEDKAAYEHFFTKPLSDVHTAKLNDEQRKYEQKIMQIGRRLQYVIQTEKRGFGHAVFQAEPFTNGEPVLLMLGDTLYRSLSNKPAALQLIEAYEKYSMLTVGFYPVELSTVSHFGIMNGIWENREETVMAVKNIVEKPTAYYSENNLAMKRKDGSREYCSIFGQYILTNEVFRQLEADIAAADEKGDLTKEIDLTHAMQTVCRNNGMMAVRLKALRYDMGNPKALLQTLNEFSSPTIPA